MKKTIIAIVVVVIVAVGLYFIIKSTNSVVVNNETIQNSEVAPVTPVDKTQTVLGKSVNGRDIVAYHYGAGTDEVLFVGGIHGGYEWNTSLVAYNLMNYLKNNPTLIPANVKVTVVPVLNPDGLSKVVSTTTAIFSPVEVSTSQDQLVAGRFNGNTVDLNRNFDCDWQANAKWQNKTVSGGASAFSEPESQAIKTYIEANVLKAVVVYYSAAGGVFSSSCHNGILAETRTLTNVYAKAAGYPAKEEFNFYEITGDMVNWLAKKNIPAISVLLTNHEDVEWSKNQAGIEAVLKYFAK
jgi:hypothetical protein